MIRENLIGRAEGTIRQKNQSAYAAKAGLKVDLDPALDILFLAPRGDSYRDLNDYSAVIIISYKKTSFLLCGDAEKASEDEMLMLNADLKADVIKIAHPGSSTLTSIRFLERVRPELAIISVGLYDKGKMDGMINRKWTEKSSKIPMKIAGPNPAGYPAGRRHAPNESDRSDQGTSTAGPGLKTFA